MGWCMDPTATCSRTYSKDGRGGRPGKIVGFVKSLFQSQYFLVCVCLADPQSLGRSWCHESGILCCDGEVTDFVTFDLPSQFIDAIQPSDAQLSNDANLDLFSSISDDPVQYSLLGDTSDDLFASNDFASGDIVSQDDLVATNGDASWFQG